MRQQDIAALHQTLRHMRCTFLTRRSVHQGSQSRLATFNQLRPNDQSTLKPSINQTSVCEGWRGWHLPEVQCPQEPRVHHTLERQSIHHAYARSCLATCHLPPHLLGGGCGSTPILPSCLPSFALRCRRRCLALLLAGIAHFVI